MTMLPRYPVYVISKGRAGPDCLTVPFLLRDRVPFRLVVEPQEADAYRSRFGAQHVSVLPFGNLGQGSIPARNWCWEHALSIGAERHWILDDNLAQVKRRDKGKRIPCASGVAFAAVEDFTERYTNVAISGLNYEMFLSNNQSFPPFLLNTRVYSCLLIKNTISQRWRGRYNEDTDLCLQVLAAGYCTLLINAFCVWKMRTMHMKGGNMAELYQGDGRLAMARSLERLWPGVVTVTRRFGRPQHLVNWRKFNNQLIPRDPDAERGTPNEYGMRLTQTVRGSKTNG